MSFQFTANSLTASLFKHSIYQPNIHFIKNNFTHHYSSHCHFYLSGLILGERGCILRFSLCRVIPPMQPQSETTVGILGSLAPTAGRILLTITRDDSRHFSAVDWVGIHQCLPDQVTLCIYRGQHAHTHCTAKALPGLSMQHLLAG